MMILHIAKHLWKLCAVFTIQCLFFFASFVLKNDNYKEFKKSKRNRIVIWVNYIVILDKYIFMQNDQNNCDYNIFLIYRCYDKI